MAATMVLLVLWAILILGRDLPLGRFLHRVMVEVPAAVLNRITRGQILLVIVLIVLGSITAWYGEADGVRMLSMAVPEITTWLATFEVSAYLDMLAALATAMTAMRRRGARDFVIALFAPLSRRPTMNDPRPRCSRRRSDIPPANDDEDGARFALAS